MTYRFVIKGRLEGLNSYIGACRTNPHKGASLKKIEQQKVIFSILTQLKGVRIETPIFINFKWYEPNKKRDKDNISSFGRKVILDALQETEIIKNDSWKYILGFKDEFFIDSKNPYIEVEIREITEIK